MRFFVCTAMIVSMLFLSLDGAMDIVSQGHPHGDAAELVDADSITTKLPGSDTGSENHCEHCCHGHFAGIVVQLASMALHPAPGTLRSPPILFDLGHARAPPTPPPNA